MIYDGDDHTKPVLIIRLSITIITFDQVAWDGYDEREERVYRRPPTYLIIASRIVRPSTIYQVNPHAHVVVVVIVVFIVFHYTIIQR